jgi:prepilin-type N-terminal cleavage/methylation domain-containing protein
MRQRRANGFSLVELISVIVVLGVIGTSTATLVSTYARAYSDAAVQSRLHVEASTALDRIVRELRSMPGDPDHPDCPDIRSASMSEVRWGDTHHLRLRNGVIEISEDLVGYGVLLSDVTSLSLQFHDEDDRALLSGPGDQLIEDAEDTQRVRRVTVSITMSRSGRSEIVRTKLFTRCAITGTNS